MTVGLYLIAVPARDETRNRTGRILTPAAPAAIRAMAVPAAVWTETNPDRLDGAAQQLAAAAHWLRAQHADPATRHANHDHPTLFDQDQ